MHTIRNINLPRITRHDTDRYNNIYENSVGNSLKCNVTPSWDHYEFRATGNDQDYRFFDRGY